MIDRLKHNWNVSSRREFFTQAGSGLAGMALASMLAETAHAAPGVGLDPLLPKKPHHQPLAKSVIFLFMEGGPSHVDLFDPKPLLTKLDGKPVPDSIGKPSQTSRGTAHNTLMASRRKWKQYGQSGMWVSDWYANVGEHVDDLTVIRSCWADGLNHVGSVCQMNTGSILAGRPSMGAWVTYGLGSDNENLPGFVVLISSGVQPNGGKASFGSGFLPSVFQGVQCRSKGDPVLYASDPPGMDRELRRMAMLDALERRPEGDPGPCEVSVFPVDEDNSSVPLACVRFTVVVRDGCTMIEDVCVDCSVRTTLLPTCLVQDLTAGLAPALVGDEELPSTNGPQVVGERVTVEASGRRIVLPVTAPLMASSVHGSARVHTLSGRRSDGWERQTIENTRYDPKRQAIVVRLVDRLADELVRVVVSGSGDRPVMGLDGLVPLEGVVGDRPQSRYDGIDAVWTFVYEPPEPESDDVDVVEIDVVEVDVVEQDDSYEDDSDDDSDDDDSAEEVQA
jgi:hypothetical protein